MSAPVRRARSLSTPEAAVDFVGGRGLGAYYLFKLLRAGHRPSRAREPADLRPGPLSGTAAPGSARAAVVTKSPQTGLYLFCITGGELGPALKRSGYDVIILTGRAEKPVYVEVAGGTAKIRSAAHLWGLDTQATQEFIREELPRRQAGRSPASARAASGRCPTPACINERRALGRGGAGAVMGSKNVKALVVREGARGGAGRRPRGASGEPCARPATELRDNPFTSGPLKLHGSVSTVAVTLNSGIMPADNWQRSATPDEAGGLLGDDAARQVPGQGRALRRPLPGALHQGDRGPRRARTPAPPPRVPSTRPSTPSAPPAAIYDLGAVIAADQLCDLLGIDTISVGVTISFAMECFERGLLDAEDTGGIDLRFGNAEAMLQLIRDAAYRRGFGARIALGTRALAEEIGRGSEAFAMHCQGHGGRRLRPARRQGHGARLRLRPARRLPPRRRLHRHGRADQPRPRPLRRHGQGADHARHAQPQGRRGGLGRHLRLPLHRHAGRHPGRARRGGHGHGPWPPPTSTSPASGSTRWSASSTCARGCAPRVT